jgi:hypothetical protein
MGGQQKSAQTTRHQPALLMFGSISAASGA